ncbi:RagB/SusD family nutrient uptake outer membrane protein [Gallalistipes aquisgranensis]|uniref:RagB/SusD family nutrient uptake outer membrane protein n=1 Tax=Gallalistipes aquisgranensis TaxID=2779358 RepID=UPI001CF89B95|nr:RagB/SusD family nutrient uptake outer membrane protein [Gallalistipes aquisgranensis]MBE5034003.1 RagB/SusD family nutrient uptake outer membrane protein [Gallalistipes aquisgranensis]
MKKILLFGALLGVLSSCSEFMKESSQDLMIPKSVKDYKEFLYGEGLANGTDLTPYLELMSDDVVDVVDQCPIVNDWREKMWGYYTWQQNPELDVLNTQQDDKAWDRYYHKVLIANIIIDAVPDAEGSDAEKNDLYGEAYFLRALSYYMLVNLYGEPYDEATAASAKGVPVNLEATVQNVQFARASVEAVYGQIESDLQASIRHFKQAGIEKTIFRPNLATSYLMASRVALVMKNWDHTIKYADSVEMVSSAGLYDLNSFSGDKTFLNRQNPELLFSYGGFSLHDYIKNYSNWTAAYMPSPELMGLYEKGEEAEGEEEGPAAGRDLRLDHFYTMVECWAVNYQCPFKYYGSDYNIYPQVFRLAEAYLNRAEAYAESGNTAGAVADLNALRRNRFTSGYELPAGLSREETIARVRDERRMELAFEGFRWFDLRRWGCPKIEHVYTDVNNPVSGQTYVLEAGSVSYTLPIPRSELDKNLVIENINRPVSNPK